MCDAWPTEAAPYRQGDSVPRSPTAAAEPTSRAARRPAWLRLAAALVLSLSLAGCGKAGHDDRPRIVTSAEPKTEAEWSAIVAAAKVEGEVTWYTTYLSPDVLRPIVAKYEQLYPGITINIVTGSGDDLAVRIFNEKRSGRLRADVHDSNGELMKSLGMLQRYVSPSTRHYDPMYRDPEGYWAGTLIYIATPAYNTRLVKPGEEPKSYDDLLDPKWRGKMAWSDSSSTATAIGFIGNILETRGEQAGRAYLQRLATQRVANVRGNMRALLDRVASEQYAITLTSYAHHAAAFQKRGAPIRPLWLAPTVIGTGVSLLLKDAPHPNAGKLLIELLQSKEGQEVFKRAGYVPAHPDVDANIAELKPGVGHYPFHLMTGARFNAKEAEWKEIFDSTFR
jgi:iron(III) transport system substrate-binding protein